MDKILFNNYKDLKDEVMYFKKQITYIENSYKEHYSNLSRKTDKHLKQLYVYYLNRLEGTEKQILDIESSINTLSEPFHTIIYKRYVEGKTLEKIAEETFYSYGTVIRKIKVAFELMR